MSTDGDTRTTGTLAATETAGSAAGGSTDTEPTDEAMRLVRGYEPGSSFFFASPRATMLARDVDATVPKVACSSGQSELPGRVADFLSNAREFGRRDPVVVGAVPFGDSLPAHLVLPGEVLRAGPVGPAVPQGKPAAANCALRCVPEPAEYLRGIRRVLPQLERGELDKVVLARSLELTAREQIDPARMLRNLAAGNPGGYTFAVPLPRRGEDGSRDSFGRRPELRRTLLGASPELLVSRRGTRVVANPLAGSLPRADDPVEDRDRARRLLASDKDRREHAVVIDSVAEALRPLCRELHVPESPSVTSTATLWHLSTEITGELRDPDTSSLRLATAMHPTPAVCGTPVGSARSVISETEPFERGYYSGMVGWCDSSGDGEWVVAIRCGEIEDDSLRLYAGAGIVPGSEPESELAETTAKLRTALSAMGWDGGELAGT